jgi:hypothetical protein
MTDFIHIDPDRTLYSVTEDELTNLEKGAQPLWKDVCIASLSLGIPTIMNAITETIGQQTFSLGLSLFLNYLFGIIGLSLGAIFGIAWFFSAKNTSHLANRIRSKPKMELPFKTSNVGALPDPVVISSLTLPIELENKEVE